MTSTLQTVQEIRKAFTHASPTKVIGEPTYHSIKTLHDHLKDNASCIASTLGGGAHGHLGLVLDPAFYQQLTAHPFPIPVNPGPHAVVPPGTNINLQRQLVRTFEYDNYTYQTYIRTDQALKQQLLESVDNAYVEALKDSNTGYSQVTISQLLQHLYTTYGNVTAIDLQENHAQLTKPYDPNMPISHLFKQIEDAGAFAAAAGAPFSDRQIIDNAYLLILSTQVYKDECKEWIRKPINEQTWANFKLDFNQAYRERQTIQKLEKQGNAQAHFGANATTIDNEQAPPPHETLSSLTNATLETGSNVLNLAHENAALREQVHQLTNLVETLTTTVAETNTQLAAFRNHHNPSIRTPSGGGRGRGRGRSRMGGRDPGFNTYSKHYCWSHGLTRTSSHTSANCRTPRPGHKSTAIFSNRMGGSDYLCHLVTNTVDGTTTANE